MSRQEKILQGITKRQRGIEIAPYFAPLTPKRDGWNCLVLDVFDRPTLLQKAEVDPNIPREGLSLIEEVDFVGSATQLADLVPIRDHGTFDYIVSSHNFEHIPNPVRFLQGCQRVLKPGGILSMAVPDGRACFDFFRPHTTLVDWLDAFIEQRQKPKPGQVFALAANMAGLCRDEQSVGAFSLEDPVTAIMVTGDLSAAYQKWVTADDNGDYQDSHCSVMTPASLELIITECQYLGLVSFEIGEISTAPGCEFFVRLVDRPDKSRTDTTTAELNATRTRLLQRIWDERARASSWGQDLVRELQRSERTSAAHLVDVGRGAARHDPIAVGRRQLRRLAAMITG
ncbi:MAG: class I SAM-dependent methyltransferase [Rhodomicrobiaceae bacterium]